MNVKEEGKSETEKKFPGGKNKYNTGAWNPEEQRRFFEGLELFGRDWKKVIILENENGKITMIFLTLNCPLFLFTPIR